MKQAGRWAFNMIGGLSLVLCLGTTGLWVVTQHFAYSVHRSGPVAVNAVSDNGQLTFAVIDVAGTRMPAGLTLPPQPTGWQRYWYMPSNPKGRQSMAPFMGGVAFLGFEFWNYDGGPIPNGPGSVATMSPSWGVVVPHWAISGPTAVLAMWWARRVRTVHRRRHRLHFGLCLNCGYNLRATPDRCPECGTVANQLPAAGKEHAAPEGGRR